MRIDLPRCNFKNCRYCFDSNCTKKSEYERCEYQLAKAEAIKEFAENIKDIDLYLYVEEHYKYAEFYCEVRQDWFSADIDNLVKEMTEDK